MQRIPSDRKKQTKELVLWLQSRDDREVGRAAMELRFRRAVKTIPEVLRALKRHMRRYRPLASEGQESSLDCHTMLDLMACAAVLEAETKTVGPAFKYIKRLASLNEHWTVVRGAVEEIGRYSFAKPEALKVIDYVTRQLRDRAFKKYDGGTSVAIEVLHASKKLGRKSDAKTALKSETSPHIREALEISRRVERTQRR